MTTLSDFDTRRAELAAEARALLDNADGTDLAGADLERFEAITAELEDIAERSVVLDQFQRVAGHEHGDGTRDAGWQQMRRVEPYDGTPANRLAPDDLIARASSVLERLDDEAIHDRVAPLLDRADEEPEAAMLARQILATSNPAYMRAYRRWVRDPHAVTILDGAERAAWIEADAVRAALQLSNTGAAMIPTTLDPTIRLTNNGAINPFREIADVRTTLTDQWDGVTSAGVTAEWVAEATEVSDATPALTSASITVHKADAYVEASYEQAADSNFPEQLPRLFADAKDRLEAEAFATGNGSGKPFGVVTRLAATTASRVAGSSGAAGAADLVIGDIYNLSDALPPRYRPNSSWLGEHATYTDVRQFATGSGPSHAFWADLGVDQPSQLLGRPVYESSVMDSTVVSGSNDDVLILGDFRQGYVVVDRLGMAIIHNGWVLGANRRPTAVHGFLAYWRTGGDVVDANAFRMLRL